VTAELGTQAMLVDLADSTANDLSATRAWRPVEQELRRGKVKALTIDLPCNTWSRARRAPPWSRMPKPLRGDGPGELWGLKGLTEKDQAKVAAANRMTRAAFRAIKVADSLSIPGFLENPRKSRLWQTRGIKNLLKSASTQIVNFSMCQYGTQWRKDTRLLVFGLPKGSVVLDVCQGRRGKCSRTHRAHLNLTGIQGKHFTTAQAQVYPRGFALAVMPTLLRATA